MSAEPSPTGPDVEQIKAFVRKHKVALGIGAAVLLVVAMSNGGDQPGPGFDPNVPITDTGGGGGSSSDGGFDKRKWDEDQRRDDIKQRDRIDTIREVERCVGDDGRVYEAPLGTCS